MSFMTRIVVGVAMSIVATAVIRTYQEKTGSAYRTTVYVI